jgi:hypothetical protein
MWSMTIEKVSNGWVLRSPPDDPEIETERVLVIEEHETADGEEEANISLLYEVAEHFGLTNLRWNRKLGIMYSGPDEEDP